MKWVITCLALAVILVCASGAAEAGTIHLGMAVDASGSILPGDWDTIRTSLGSAIETADWSGATYQLTIVMFGDGTRDVYDAAITNANRAAVGATVAAMDRTGMTSYTHMSSGIYRLNALVDWSDPGADNHVYNILTDGLPNGAGGTTATIDAKNAAIGLGLEELSAEFIGSVGATGYNFLLNDMVFPTPVDTTAPFDPGFLVAVSAGSLRSALDSKLQAVTSNVVPLPSAAWGGLMMLVGFGIARIRRRRT